MPSPSEPDDLSRSAWWRNDARCDDFEARWAGGGRISVEQYLALVHLNAIPEPERSALLAELVRVEVECRLAAGESVSRSELIARFPALSDLVGELLGLDDSRPGNAVDEAGATPPAGRPRAGSRYSPLSATPHAEGGLGRVFRARDAELGRIVALKELRPDRDRDPALRARFFREAEITGALEHPGIVPIHTLGRHDDGRPYYAMRFIDGQSLKEAVQASPGAAGDLPRGRWRKHLARFLTVCDAIAYAHSRGVVHRDIKPENIMLGPFGETLVVDWGLAKVLDVADPVAGPVEPPSAGLGGETLAGREIGTPLYMSPEQAEGRLDEIGPASDVYGLGATLYFILTGSPPVSGATLREVLAKVRAGDFLPPRAVRPETPPALEAIVLRAMALAPADRYASAADLAADIERWLADEPVSAHREPLADRASRWARRHRALTASSAAVLVLAAIGLAGFAAHQRSVNARLRAANEATTRAEGVADRRLDQAMAAIADYHAGVSEDVLLGRAELAGLRERLLDRPMRFYEDLSRELDRIPKPDARALRLLAEGRFSLGRILDLLGRHDQARDQLRQALAAFRRLEAARPLGPDERLRLATIHRNLGVVERLAGRPEEAAREYLLALGVLEAEGPPGAADDPVREESALLLNNLGNAQRDLGRLGDAEASFRRAIDLGDALVAASRGDLTHRVDAARARANLSLTLELAGRRDEAIEAGRRAVALLSSVVAERPEEWEYVDLLGGIHGSLGNLLAESGRTAEALAALREAVALGDRAVAAQPRVVEFRDRLAYAHGVLGSLLIRLDRRDEAIVACRRANAAFRDLAANHPGVPDYAEGLAASASDLGILLGLEGRAEEAIAAHREAVAIGSRLVADHPEIPDFLDSLAGRLNNLAEALTGRDQLEEAETVFRKSVAARSALIEARGDGARTLSALGVAQENLGTVLVRLGREPEAVQTYRLAVLNQRKAIAADPAAPAHRRAIAGHYDSLLGALRALGRIDDAVEAARERLALLTDDPDEIYRSARQLALCLAPMPQGERADALAAEVTSALHHAASAGWLAPGRAERDPAFAPIRDHGDFRTFLARSWTRLDAAFPAHPFAP